MLNLISTISSWVVSLVYFITYVSNGNLDFLIIALLFAILGSVISLLGKNDVNVILIQEKNNEEGN